MNILISPDSFKNSLTAMQAAKAIQRGIHRVYPANCFLKPMAVPIAHDVGPGAELTMRIGGKVTPFSGNPLDLKVVVNRIYKEIAISSWGGGTNPCDAAVVSSGETELPLVSRRILGKGLQSFRDLGVEPKDKQFVLSKHILVNEKSDNLGEVKFVFGLRTHYLNWQFSRIDKCKWPWIDEPFHNGN